MCKSIEEGGKRCPVHRVDVRSFLKEQINSINEESDLFPITLDIAEEVFLNIRKVADDGEPLLNYAQYVTLVGSSNAMSEEDYDPIDAKTQYAIQGFSYYYKGQLRDAIRTIESFSLKNGYSPLTNSQLIDIFKKSFYSKISKKELQEKSKGTYYENATTFKQRIELALADVQNLMYDNGSQKERGKFERIFFNNNLNIGYDKDTKEFISYSNDEKYFYGKNEICVDSFIKAKNWVEALKIKRELKKAMQKNPSAPLYAVSEKLRLILHRTNMIVDKNDIGKNIVKTYQNNCSDCGQFINFESHTCPEKMQRDVINLFNNKEIQEQLQDLNGKSILEISTDQSFIVNKQFLIEMPNNKENSNDDQKDIVCIANITKLNNKIDQPIIATFSLKDYYVVANDFNDYATVRRIEDKSILNESHSYGAAEVLYDEYVWKTPIEKIKNVPLLKNPDETSYFKMLPHLGIANATLKNGDYFDFRLESVTDTLSGTMIFKKENGKVSPDMGLFYSAYCRRGCSQVLSLYDGKKLNNGYCKHKLKLKQDLEEILNNPIPFQESPQEFIAKSFMNMESLQKDNEGKTYFEMNDFNSYVLEHKDNNAKTQIIDNVLSNLNIRNIKDFNEESIKSFISEIHKSLPLASYKSRELKTEPRENIKFITQNVDYIKKEKFHVFSNEDGAILSYSETMGNEIVDVKCTCSDYLEKYYCEHTYIYNNNFSAKKDVSNDTEELVIMKKILNNIVNSDLKKKTLLDDIKSLGLILGSEKIIKDYNKLNDDINNSYTSIQDYVSSTKEYQRTLLSKINNEKETVVNYSENMNEFYNDYKSAKSKNRNNEVALEYKYEDITNGICAPVKGARKFGLELEVVHPKGLNHEERRKSVDNLINDFKLAKLIPEDITDVGEYGNNKYEGYVTWSIEEDSTVDLEIVSPPLYDSPESWKQVEIATAVLNMKGFLVDERWGGPVNISAQSLIDELSIGGNYLEAKVNMAKVLELKNNFDENYEIFKRLGQDTLTKKHRGSQWCMPNFVPIGKSKISNKNLVLEQSNDAMYSMRLRRESGINLSQIAKLGYYKETNESQVKTMRAEYRIFDGSLEKEVIQQRVKLAAALAFQSEMNVEKQDNHIYAKPHNYQSSETEKYERDDIVNELITKNKKREEKIFEDTNVNPRTHTFDTLEKDSLETRKLFDSLFSRAEDKKDMATLYAMTKW